MPNPNDNQQLRLAAIAAMTLKDEEIFWEADNTKTSTRIAGKRVKPLPWPIEDRPWEPIHVPHETDRFFDKAVTAAIGMPRHNAIEIITPMEPKESVFHRIHSSLHNYHAMNETTSCYMSDIDIERRRIWDEMEEQRFSEYGTNAVRYHDLLLPNLGDIDTLSNMIDVDNVRAWCLDGIDFACLKKDNIDFYIRSLGLPDLPMEPPSIESLKIDFPEVTSRTSMEDLLPKKKSLEFDRTNTKLNRRYRRQQAKKS